MSANYSRLAAIIVAMVAMGPACGSPPGASTGSAIVVARALQAAGIAKAQVTVQGSRLGAPISRTLSQVSSEFSTLFEHLPPGDDYAFTVSATDDGTPPTLQLTGSIAAQVISANHTANILLTLNTATPSISFINSAPVIDAISTSSLISSYSEQIRLQATAHDPDSGDTARLVFRWAATCGTISNVGNSAGNDAIDFVSTAVFTAPSRDTNCSVSLSVTDPTGASAATALNVAVRSNAGQSTVAISFEDGAPVISGLSADPGELIPGGETNLSVVATSPGGATMDYAWTSSCRGDFALPTSADTVFTLDPSAADSACIFTVVVADGLSPTGQQRTRVANHLTLAVGAPTLLGPPVFGVAYQSEDTLDDGDVVILAVAANDPAGGTIHFQWKASTGEAPVASDPSSLGFGPGVFASAATWTAPSGASNGPLAIVAVTATGTASSCSSTYTFVLTPGKSVCAVQNVLCPASQVCDPGTGRCIDMPAPPQ